ncbi:MAG: MgtC/SapB family protein [Deltaproteobacteria bacterium]|nr:MgtC/SapB family protein [Deltaproteobacteria bacterium]
MEPYETHLALAAALAVGLLVGLEREQSKAERGGNQLGGIRTYPIFALVGAVSTLLGPASMWLPLVSLLGVFALVAISYAADIKRDADHGMTTEISVVGVYLLGALAAARGVVEPVADRLLLVAALGVAITFLLSSKPWLHSVTARVTRDDFFATVKFLIVAVIVLPLLPNVDVGPLQAINPRSLGLMVVTIAGLSFLGYVAIKLFGAKRGLLVGAALGGLVSSTATTLSFAGRTKEQPALAPVAAGAIAIAWTIMLVRVGVVVALIEPSLLRTLAMPLGAMVVAALVGMLLTFRRGGETAEQPQLKNPFELGSAIKIGLVFGVVLLVTKAANVYLGAGGLYLAAAISGATDVDAVVISSAKLASGGVGEVVATTAITIAIAANTIVKTIMAWSIGRTALGKRVAVTGVLIIVAGGVALAVTALA